MLFASECEMYKLHIKRIYEAPEACDGYRILIDRLWPRGIRKDEARLDGWFKSIAPTTLIRKAFNHETANMESFRKSYIEELESNPEAAAYIVVLADKLKHGNVTLVYGAKDEKYNHAVVLKAWLEEKLR